MLGISGEIKSIWLFDHNKINNDILWCSLELNVCELKKHISFRSKNQNYKREKSPAIIVSFHVSQGFVFLVIYIHSRGNVRKIKFV